MTVDYQTALNRWGRAQAEAATGLPAALMDGDCTLEILHNPGYAYSSWTYEPNRTEATLTVPLGDQRTHLGHRCWTRDWNFVDGDTFDFAEVLGGILAAANEPDPEPW